MERIRINQANNRLTSGEYIIDSFVDLLIETESNATVDILVENLSDKSSLKMIISENSHVNLSVLAEAKVDSSKMDITVKKDGYLEVYFADFSKEVINLNCTIDLKNEGATAYFKLASLAANKDLKNIDVSIKHLSPRTYGRVDNYGVCNKTQQNAKIMVFDEASNAIAKPILKIDENDIEASHAAVVGKINDEHLFYLTSRGISETEAKELITFGYLKPILLGFKEEQVKEHISSLIEGRM